MKLMRALKFFGLAASFALLFTACTPEAPKDPDGNDPDGPDEPVELAECLKGSNYYVLIMDGITYPKIESKVVEDLRVNDTDMFLYIWDETYVPGTSSGPNYFGEVEGWPCLTVSSVGWSGAGFCLGVDRTADLSAITGDYVLHIAMKSKQARSSHNIILNNQATVCIGSDPFVDQGVTTNPYANFTRDGEWNEIEIPMSEFFKQATLRDPITDDNVISILSGGTAGTTLDIDAMFIYKPAAK